jgi:uncharacterized protein YkwD
MMIIIRPLILILVFFGMLFALREPIRHVDENLVIINYAYISPSVSYIKNKVEGLFTHTDTLYGEMAPGAPLVPVDGVLGTASSTTSTDQASTTPKGTMLGGAKEVLVAKDDSQTVDSSRLSIAGIFTQTNKERADRSVGILRLNNKLNAAAERKLQDMFTNQYFEHVSPSGVHVSDLVREAEYEYIVVGENLALGNFGGDVPVVTAWMNSPGHRANILDTRFSEIGIAVGKGMYKGKEQWLAVQHFAKPLASCEGPKSELKTSIETETKKLAVIESDLQQRKKQIEATATFSVEYSALAETYNALVSEYNARLEGLKDEIAIYNLQVRRFNTCAGISNTP